MIANAISLSIRKVSIPAPPDVIQTSHTNIEESMDITVPRNRINPLIEGLSKEDQIEMIKKHASFAAKRAIGQTNVQKRNPNQGFFPYVLSYILDGGIYIPFETTSRPLAKLYFYLQMHPVLQMILS